MKNFLENVSVAEKKWLKIIFDYSRGRFTLSPLPSHDHFHHLRVWNYAKDIISRLANNNIIYSQEEIEELLIAVFFHDMGMTITREKKHGFESRLLCSEFLNHYTSLIPRRFETILDMIERHDDKDYASNKAIAVRPSLDVILNISDDLDAFGYIGVYRYIEIYHFRGISLKELPIRIIANLKTRFQNFARQLAQLEDFVILHRDRFDCTCNFFIKLENELQKPYSSVGSAMRIVNILIEFSNGPETDIHSLLHFTEKLNSHPQEKKFIHDLIYEWDEFDTTTN